MSSKISDLAFSLNLSAGIPGLNLQSKTADKFDEYAYALYDYVINNLHVFLAINNEEGYHVGMAFSHILERTPYAENSTKFKISLRCTVIGLWRAIKMGTVQSIIATHRLVYIIDRYKTSHFVSMFMNLIPLNEILEMVPDDLKRTIERIYKCIKYFLVRHTKPSEEFKKSNMKACNIGLECMEAMHDECCEELRGYSVFGII